MTPNISKAISFTRFPIILGPVMIHCQQGFSETPFRLFWGEMVGRITVPLFFIISEYLFFQHFDGTIKSFTDKFKKRVRTLIVPYNDLGYTLTIIFDVLACLTIYRIMSIVTPKTLALLTGDR